MKNVIAILILAVITVSIVIYLIREKKKGAVCIGCPYSGSCSGGSCHSLDDFDSSKIVK
jgi:hypothetical protein